MNSRASLPASVQTAFVAFALLFSVTLSVCSRLTVLVRLNDGQITEELLEADSEKDIITVEFRQTDGTLITFLSDFKRVSINPTKYNSTTSALLNLSAALLYLCSCVATEHEVESAKVRCLCLLDMQHCWYS